MFHRGFPWNQPGQALSPVPAGIAAAAMADYLVNIGFFAVSSCGGAGVIANVTQAV